ncbi:MAG: putative peptidase [Firmicutes bacterium ADurb.Bin193]|nr:MAG: putative peptidase [Firmicutes bacterium ADurb.Bin193]
MVTKQELENRLSALCSALGNDWDTAFIINKINQYYLTGTMQDGLLVIKKDGTAAYFVRRSFERARDESPLDSIYPMSSYKDAAAIIGGDCKTTYIEAETMTIGAQKRLEKYFSFDRLLPIEKSIMSVRSVKSPYETELLEHTGRLHNDFLVNIVPSYLEEGISEAELTGRLYRALLTHGHQGVVRFGMFQTEMPFGQIGFGENSLYPTSFDGPGGMKGMSAAVPTVGSRERLLRKGDLVFIDFAYGVEGYHTDKSQVYMFGAKPSAEVETAHRRCINVQKQTASFLKAGSIPSDIYNKVMEGLDDNFKENFMGFKNRQAKFLGHGVGLQVDETPVIANGFNEPLTENTVIALEPKKGIEGIGMVGVEDTYIVTKDGGRCITGGGCDIIVKL